jgi:hypothetical protein
LKVISFIWKAPPVKISKLKFPMAFLTTFPILL